MPNLSKEAETEAKVLLAAEAGYYFTRLYRSHVRGVLMSSWSSLTEEERQEWVNKTKKELVEPIVPLDHDAMERDLFSAVVRK